ncbi:DUF2326 domain-containing protein [Lactiplantibacillus plantarum]|uniref:DUF2326 domain-containing protein n=1 Tax=Lactiplantibacillus plantarum TaxID=1590 RepID=UPI0021A8AFC2|nr:DUF2326 domain-containing protein [Lactiplantibacillus plantarum]MCT3258844.1 DUF2326 domain-containing protein [Lactiplantibacillus plantarum]
MFLKKMKIIKNDIQVIRTMHFKEGVNFVVDEEDSSKHNHVGKTTALKLIDIALGSRDKKYIYIDSETGAKNGRLEKLVNKDKISVILSVAPSFRNSKDETQLKVDLFSGGYKYINGEKTSVRKYNNKLNEIFFKNNENNPTFRSLIPSFVRVSAKKDSYDFLKNLHSTTSNLQYREIYNYLFNITSMDDSGRLESLKQDLNQVKKAEKQYRSFGNNDYSEEVIDQLLLATENDCQKIQMQINAITRGTDFLKQRKYISKRRQEYIDKNNEISDLEYRISITKDDLSQIEIKDSWSINDGLVKKLFNEIQPNMPQVQRTYEDLIKFNKALSSNRRSYLNGIKEELEKQLKTKKEEQKQFLLDNTNWIGLIKNDDISQYDHLNKKLIDSRKKYDRLEEQKKTLTDFSSKRKSLEQEIEKVKQKSAKFRSNYQEQLKLFNDFFGPLEKSISGGSPVMVYHEDLGTFPLSIEDLDEGTSTGTLKTMIICYDIAYQKFANRINKNVPNFIVHDILENIEGEVLNKLIKEVNETNCQMIIGILKEKLVSSGIDEDTQKKHQLLSLSNVDRLFEPSNNNKQ